ncbi:MAG: sensor histidine kinase [Faecousia sp.]
MSLKRRNGIACCLLLLAAICWTFGYRMVQRVPEKTGIVATSYPPARVSATEATTHPTSIPVTLPTEKQTASYMPSETNPADETAEEANGGSKFLGFLLCFAAAASAGIAVVGFWQTAPILGPDGVSILAAIGSTAYDTLQNMDYVLWTSTFITLTTYANILTGFTVLFALRELWGWIRARFSLSWCLAHRIAKRLPKPQLSLLVFVGWIILALTGIGYHLIWFARYGSLNEISFWGLIAATVFGFLCLWKYGADLEHFKKQLSSFQRGLPITVGDGAFAQTEAQLLDVQAQHEEAVHTAVTSERFKVDLISNVSHDLRTPLTAILGYSELLQKETLSPEGQEQLCRLHQKAGYMSDLVESLFELTKVSSGVIEAKKEEIDLIRLLEQTTGLFDDQLTNAGLSVRRSYASDSIPVVTDGARMHQVFANLLGNAIKYALTGTRIYLEVQETECSYLIRMMNTASYEMDFKPDEIMQRFARGDKARSTKGSGLGLAIAQTYTESVGGKFHVAVDGDQFSAIVELPKTERNL